MAQRALMRAVPEVMAQRALMRAVPSLRENGEGGGGGEAIAAPSGPATASWDFVYQTAVHLNTFLSSK